MRKGGAVTDRGSVVRGLDAARLLAWGTAAAVSGAVFTMSLCAWLSEREALETFRERLREAQKSDAAFEGPSGSQHRELRDGEWLLRIIRGAAASCGASVVSFSEAEPRALEGVEVISTEVELRSDFGRLRRLLADLSAHHGVLTERVRLLPGEKENVVALKGVFVAVQAPASPTRMQTPR